MSDAEPTSAELNEIAKANWRAALHTEWSRRRVGLAFSVYWIATKGDASNEADDTALDWATGALLALLRAGKLEATGIIGADPFPQGIEPRHFDLAWASFIPEQRDIDMLASTMPSLVWNFEPDPSTPDRFVRWTDDVVIDRVTIARDDMVRLWPPAIDANRRRPGRPAAQFARVESAMRVAVAGGYDLAGATDAELEARFAATRGVCRRARAGLLENKN